MKGKNQYLKPHIKSLDTNHGLPRCMERNVRGSVRRRLTSSYMLLTSTLICLRQATCC